MRDLALSLSTVPALLKIPVLQVTLALALALLLALALTLFLAPVLVLAVALALVKALVLILALILPVTLGLIQAVAMTLSLAPTLFQALEVPGQTQSPIMPPGITAKGSLRNNPGNFCKPQNLVSEGYGSPPMLKRSVRLLVRHCHGAGAFSTTGRRRYYDLDLLLFLEGCFLFPGGGNNL